MIPYYVVSCACVSETMSTVRLHHKTKQTYADQATSRPLTHHATEVALFISYMNLYSNINQKNI